MNLLKKNLPLNRSVKLEFNTYFIPLQNEPSPTLVGPKLGGALGFWVPEHVIFQESGCNIEIEWVEGSNT